MRNRQLIRQWQIVKRIDGKAGASMFALAAELGVTHRTIRRDLEALEAAGFPLVVEPTVDQFGANTRWRIVDWRKEAA